MRRAAEVPSLLANDPGVGAALALVHSMNPWQGDPIRAALANARETSGKPLLIVAPGGMPDIERAWYETRGMNVFTETDIVLEAIGAMLTPLPVAAGSRVECLAAGSVEPPIALVKEQWADLPQRMLTEPESLDLLRAFAVPVVDTVECATSEAVLAAAERLGWPVVLKGVVDGVAHKSELGLVRTNLRDAAALRAAYDTLGTPRAIVQPMVPAALEAIAGISRSPGVGLVLLCGLGGIYAEALRDVCIWPIPVTREAIAGKLMQSSLGRVLASPRWQHPGSASALIALLDALQNLAVTLGDRLEAVDINPVMLGAGVAVDALVVRRP
jgi:acyl-CoA synthetase (NDP forming)